ncbi:MAG: ArsR/SmtB family transcription factor [Bacteroidales bacterium]
MEENLRLARYCKALAHPARISILKLLLSKQSCICGDIVKELPLAQSTVSQHLKELKKAGLIQGSITPPKIKYCINKEHWDILQEAFRVFPG